jgi:hypothetical protein
MTAPLGAHESAHYGASAQWTPPGLGCVPVAAPPVLRGLTVGSAHSEHIFTLHRQLFTECRPLLGGRRPFAPYTHSHASLHSL